MTATLGALRRLLSRQAADRTSLRAGRDPYRAAVVSPGMWVALG